MSLFADTVAPVQRNNTDELFLIRIVATPVPENDEAKKVGGAYVNCWVDAEDLRVAEQAALDKIREEQWRPSKFESWEIVCRQCYIDGAEYADEERTEYLERVEEAFVNGVALAFNCWPVDAPDSKIENP